MVKKGKSAERWQPLPQNSSTMQVLIIPEVDEFGFDPEEMTVQELKNLSIFIDQSNKSLEVENMIFETYLTKMDPNALAKMNQILEAAAVALQKAERAAQSSTGQSTLSVNREIFGSKITEDSSGSKITEDSSGSDSGSGTIGSSHTTTKLGAFGFSDKAPKIQASQKIEIVNREMDELRNELENFRNKAKKKNYLLRCRNEELSIRLQEVLDAQKEFETKLLVDGVDRITGKLPGEKFLRYLETKLKAEEIEIDRMRIKTGSLKAHLKKVTQQLEQKQEMGGVLHAVDFEKLQAVNRECQERLDEKVAHVVRVKKINGKYGTKLNANKKKLHQQVKILEELQQTITVKEKLIEKFMVDEEKVNAETDIAENAFNKISKLTKMYTVPALMDYIKKKAELHDLKKEIKVRQRKLNIKELVLASQAHKLRSMAFSSKSIGLENSLMITGGSRVIF